MSRIECPTCQQPVWHRSEFYSTHEKHTFSTDLPAGHEFEHVTDTQGQDMVDSDRWRCSYCNTEGPPEIQEALEERYSYG